jgi:hypothetical protein
MKDESVAVVTRASLSDIEQFFVSVSFILSMKRRTL